MKTASRVAQTVALSALLSFSATAAFAWGDTGHRIIGTLAVETLPDDVPAFLRTKDVAADVGEWAREPDRWRGAGAVHDDMRDPGHFIDVLDNGETLAGMTLDQLPPTRTAFETALVQHGETIGRSGFLPYNIVDGYQQLAKDFTLWRADTAALKFDHDPAHRAWLEADLKRREEQTIMDLGIWGHYVGDATQPMHVTVHYNGWGKGPNPEGFTTEPIHVPFEGPFVRDNVSMTAARAAMAPFKACGCAITLETARYLETTRTEVVPLYRDYKAGGLSPQNAAMVELATKQVAAGASELRDLIEAAWRASASGTLGYPPVAVSQVEAGKVDAWPLLHGPN